MKTSSSAPHVFLTLSRRLVIASFCFITISVHSHAAIIMSTKNATLITGASGSPVDDDEQQVLTPPGTGFPHDLAGELSSASSGTDTSGAVRIATAHADISATFTVPESGGFLLQASGSAGAHAESHGYEHPSPDVTFWFSGGPARANARSTGGHTVTLNQHEPAWNYELRIGVTSAGQVNFNGEIFQSIMGWSEFFRSGTITNGGVGISGFVNLSILANSQHPASAQIVESTGDWSYSLLLTPVVKAAGTVSIGNTSPVFDGAPKPVSVTTVPAGLPVQVTYDGLNTPPTNAGSYNVVATINHAEYQGASTATLTIAKAPATVALTELDQTFDGASKPIGVSTTPADLAVLVTYDGNTSAPSAVGSYAVVATVSDPNYEGGATGTLVINVDETEFESWATTNGLTPGDDGFNDDPNGDGTPNIGHFAFDTDPLGVGGSESKLRTAVAEIEGVDYLTFTLPVREGADFGPDANGQQTATVDGIVYLIQATTVLTNFAEGEVEEHATLDAGLPMPLSPGYEYRTFRMTAPLAGSSNGFMRAVVDVAP